MTQSLSSVLSGKKVEVWLLTPLPLAYLQQEKKQGFEAEVVQAKIISESSAGFLVQVIQITNAKGELCQTNLEELYLPHSKVDSMRVLKS